MTWIAVVAVGMGSYLMRVVPLFAVDRPSPRIERLLTRAGTAAITSLVVSGSLHAGSEGDAAATAAALVVGAVAAVRKASLLRVVVGGMAVYLVVATAVRPLV